MTHHREILRQGRNGVIELERRYRLHARAQTLRGFLDQSWLRIRSEDGSMDRGRVGKWVEASKPWVQST